MSSPAADYLLALASSLEAAGDRDRALKVRDLATAREAGAAEALSVKGDLLRCQGQLRQAADVFAFLDHRQPDHPRARYLSALLRGLDAPIPAFRPAPWPATLHPTSDSVPAPSARLPERC